MDGQTQVSVSFQRGVQTDPYGILANAWHRLRPTFYSARRGTAEMDFCGPTSALRQKRAPKVNKRPLQFPRLGGKRSSPPEAFYFPRMGRNQESADQEQSEEDIPCCNVGVSRAWGPEDPEPRRICPAAKCCGHLSSKVYVDSDLTVYEICVSDVAALPMEQKS
uniref:Uncharacterized protein n=1 Tax=Magallana gigas TaxID=29159 RepID=K1PP00_MAGGI